MKSINLTSLLLFLAVAAIAVFIGGREINTKIEETIKNNYQSEIESLKEKLNKQSELINSILNLNQKEDNNDSSSVDTGNNTDDGDNEPTETVKTEFEYIIEGQGVTITKYTGSKTSVQIPNTIENLPVLRIGKHAFAGTKVKSVTLPSSCKAIDWFAFYECYALNTVYVPQSVTEIGYGAFDACSKALTIYCEKDSYSQKYAQSFGISYSNFK